MFPFSQIFIRPWPSAIPSVGEANSTLFQRGCVGERFPDRLFECATELRDFQIRTAALKYLIDNVASRYQDYDPMNFKDVRFIPALNGSDHCLGTVQEVCVEIYHYSLAISSICQVFSVPWAAVNFLVLQPAYQPHANKLKIKDHPPAPQLMSRLQSKPPGSAAEARSLFSLLAGRVQGS